MLKNGFFVAFLILAILFGIYQYALEQASMPTVQRLSLCERIVSIDGHQYWRYECPDNKYYGPKMRHMDGCPHPSHSGGK